MVYIMTENDRQGSGQVSASYCDKHGDKYGFTFPELRDEGSQQMRKYFDRNAVPLNMIITTKDMKIRYKKAGSLPERIEAIIEANLP